MECSIILTIISIFAFESIRGDFWREIVRHSNYRVSENVAFNVSTFGLIHCLSMCKASSTCKSAYFDSNALMCTGLQADPDHPTGSKMSNGNARYYRQVPSGCLQDDYEWVPAIKLCFSFKHSLKLSFDDARLHCEQEHSEVMSLNSSGKFNFVVEYEKTYIEGCKTALTTGGYRSSVDNSWYWLSGEPIDMTRFCPNEPNSATSKCACLVCDVAGWCQGGIQNRLDDSGCINKRQFICERYV